MENLLENVDESVKLAALQKALGEYGLLANNYLRFRYWIVERHNIHLRRQQGALPPWSNDPVFQSSFFTNPYRENDKTTIWFRENVREGLSTQSEVLMATIIFRWFNYIPTGEVLLGRDSKVYHGSTAEGLGWGNMNNLLIDWNPTEVKRRLKTLKKIVTGAFMVKTPNGMTKVDGLCWCIDNVKKDEQYLLSELYPHKHSTLEYAHQLLTKYPYLAGGGFMAYEVVTDLRHTYLLWGASDIDTWCNIGPGAIRGLNRLLGVPITQAPPHRFLEILRVLLKYINDPIWGLPTHMPRFEMREIEHSLCEYDKYERVVAGDGKSKRNFNGR